jgi:hypothetical protein
MIQFNIKGVIKKGLLQILRCGRQGLPVKKTIGGQWGEQTNSTIFQKLIHCGIVVLSSIGSELSGQIGAGS